jgi:hypothetical protein
MTPEQQVELKRLNDIITEKRQTYLALDKEIQETNGFNHVDLLTKYKKAELELQEATSLFNEFTGNLPLKQSS